ncbi:MAG: glycosyltransferase [Nitrospirae bacterium]|nr:glycosyltransferase [Nitrospirota bacterium]
MWGRFDPDYSRNRVVRQALAALGWRVTDFRPRWPPAGDLEAVLRRVPRPDLVWVPCFRHRDLAAAARWCRRKQVPLVFDPLISQWDKQVFERGKLAEHGAAARRLKAREGRLYRRASLVVADTSEHLHLFAEAFQVPEERLRVVYVGAEAGGFQVHPQGEWAPGRPIHVLFYGSFIGLQGPGWIVEAARRYQGPPVTWHLLGAGPLLAECRARAAGLDNVRFEPWLPYRDLPARIARADVLLGVFGTTAKAGRVIPNKVFQALACGKPVVTRKSAAYPEALADGAEHGVRWVAPGDPDALAAAVARLAAAPERLPEIGRAARATFDRYFSESVIQGQVAEALRAARGGPGGHGGAVAAPSPVP